MIVDVENKFIGYISNALNDNSLTFMCVYNMYLKRYKYVIAPYFKYNKKYITTLVNNE